MITKKTLELVYLIVLFIFFIDSINLDLNFVVYSCYNKHFFVFTFSYFKAPGDILFVDVIIFYLLMSNDAEDPAALFDTERKNQTKIRISFLKNPQARAGGGWGSLDHPTFWTIFPPTS